MGSVLVDWPVAPLAHVNAARFSYGCTARTATRARGRRPPSIEAGLLEPSDWSAAAITADVPDENPERPVRFRRTFEVADGLAWPASTSPRSADLRAESTATPVGDDVLAPGWTSYRHRLRYHTYDVTDLLRAGRERIGADGRRRLVPRPLGFGRQARRLRRPTRAVAQLEIVTRRDRRIVVTDGVVARRHRARSSRASLYDGETLRRAARAAGLVDGRASTTPTGRRSRRSSATAGTLVAPTGPPVRRIEDARAGRDHHVAVRARRSSTSARTSSGRLRFRSTARPARTITLRHAEVLEHGELARGRCATRRPPTATPCAAAARDVGAAFTFHGFRYAEVDGWPGELDPGDIDGRRLPLRHGAHRLVRLLRPARRTGCTRTSSGACAATSSTSRPTARSATSASAGPATSRCSPRPPLPLRLSPASSPPGWRTSRPSRRELGGVPVYVPCVAELDPLRRWPSRPPAGATPRSIVPWVLYQRYRRRRHARAGSSTSMRAWVDQVARAAGDGRVWDTGFQFGDWLDPQRPARPTRRGAHRRRPRGHRLPRPLGRAASAAPPTSSAERDDAARYGDARRPRSPRRSTGEYVTPDRPAGRATRQTAYALALAFDLLPRPRSSGSAPARRLAELVRGDGYRIGTGFVGTPLVCDALCATPATSTTAYRLLLQRRVPVVALPGDDGRDDDLGALGQHAARRHDQPRRDDLVQPLRPRRGRRLAAPRRVAGLAPGRPGLPATTHRAAPRRRADPRRARTRRPTAGSPWPGAATGMSST